jgi:hypothetical protein
VIANLEAHALVQLALALPALERVAHAAIFGRFGCDDFIEANRLREIALALDDLRQLRPRDRELRIEIERVLQMRLRFGIVTLQELRHSGAEPQRRILRLEPGRFPERLGGSLQVPRLDRGPALLFEHADTRAVLIPGKCRRPGKAHRPGQYHPPGKDHDPGKSLPPGTCHT